MSVDASRCGDAAYGRANGDACRAGYEVGDSNTCERGETKKPVAKCDEPKRE